MKKIFAYLSILLAFIVVGCNTNEPSSSWNGSGSGSGGSEKKKVTLSVSPKELKFTGFYMISYYIDVKCNTMWQIDIENYSMFYSVNPRYNGSGNQRITVTVPEISANKQSSFTTQHGSITISCTNENGRKLSETVECVRSRY